MSDKLLKDKKHCEYKADGLGQIQFNLFKSKTNCSGLVSHPAHAVRYNATVRTNDLQVPYMRVMKPYESKILQSKSN